MKREPQNDTLLRSYRQGELSKKEADRLQPHDDKLLRSYLLGELREEEADRLEQRLLQEDELFELAEAVEADLLAAVDGGDLAPAERERVLKRLASSPQGRERLALAHSLHAEAAKEAVVVPFRPRVRPSAIRWAALAASLLVALAGLGGWLASRYSSPPPNPPGTEGWIAGSTPTPVPQKPHMPETTPPVPRPANPTLATTPKTPVELGQPLRPVVDVLTLTLTSLRGSEDEVAKLRLSPGSSMVELQIDMEGRDADSFAVVIHRDGDERPIWEKSPLEPTEVSGGPMLIVRVPAKDLSEGRYEIAVTPEGESEEMSESQVFQVVKKKR